MPYCITCTQATWRLFRCLINYYENTIFSFVLQCSKLRPCLWPVYIQRFFQRDLIFFSLTIFSLLRDVCFKWVQYPFIASELAIKIVQFREIMTHSCTMIYQVKARVIVVLVDKRYCRICTEPIFSYFLLENDSI